MGLFQADHYLAACIVVNNSSQLWQKVNFEEERHHSRQYKLPAITLKLLLCLYKIHYSFSQHWVERQPMVMVTVSADYALSPKKSVCKQSALSHTCLMSELLQTNSRQHPAWIGSESKQTKLKPSSELWVQPLSTFIQHKDQPGANIMFINNKVAIKASLIEEPQKRVGGG